MRQTILQHSKTFQSALENQCKDKLSLQLRLTLANLLSIDLHLRKNSQDLKTYSQLCAKRVSKYLDENDFKHASFEDTLTLFAIAINNISENQNQLNTLEVEAKNQSKPAMHKFVK